MSCPTCFYKRIARLSITHATAAVENAIEGEALRLRANQLILLWLKQMFRAYHNAQVLGDEPAMKRLEEGRRLP